MERREAPGSRAIGSLRSALRSADLRAKLPGPKALRVVGVPGRAGPCEGPGASRRSNAMPLSGTAPCSLFRTPRSTTSLIEQGDREHIMNIKNCKGCTGHKLLDEMDRNCIFSLMKANGPFVRHGLMCLSQ